MEANQQRKYAFLRNKYNELLLPTFFMVVSEKLSAVIDLIIISFFLGSTVLSVINLSSPLTYITGVFYILFGQGGSLLALRAQSQLKHEKVNFYFTISVIGIILLSIIYILFIFLFVDNILLFFNTPAEIFTLSKEYLLTLMLFYPLNCYILVVSFFVRSDGHPKMPFYSVFIANILNIFFDILFLCVFHMGVTSTALASVLGYLGGAVYISTYFFKKNNSFRLISLAKFKIKEIILSLKEILLNTPEVIGKIFFASKMSLITYLCSTYYGVGGLIAFLIYDNSESFVYVFLSGIMKTMSPIVTVLYKEMDFDAVYFIISRSFREIAIISFGVSALFFVFPELLLSLFNVDNPQYIPVVTLAIRITAFSLVGRCISYLLANYAQAIEQNKISSVITFLEEFLFAFCGALIFTHILGGIGIWISILIAECIPAVIYIIFTFSIQKNYKDRIHSILMLQNSNLVSGTYSKNNLWKSDEYFEQDSADEILNFIENAFKDNKTLLSNSIEEICIDIFNNNEDIADIDITIRLVNNKLFITLTNEGILYNPFLNENLMKSSNIERLSEFNCKFDYDEILGFNKTYVIVE